MDTHPTQEYIWPALFQRLLTLRQSVDRRPRTVSDLVSVTLTGGSTEVTQNPRTCLEGGEQQHWGSRVLGRVLRLLAPPQLRAVGTPFCSLHSDHEWAGRPLPKCRHDWQSAFYVPQRFFHSWHLYFLVCGLFPWREPACFARSKWNCDSITLRLSRQKK